MRICVFCGSSPGNNELYANAAQEMGRALATRKIDLVYGGGRVGLMGTLADAALGAGGTVIGVMPRSLVEREIQHPNLTKLYVVATMHERKTTMSELSDGLIALPGGAGTLEEIFEQWTWAQLGIHRKPCGFLNTNNYFDPLRKMIDRMTEEGFLRPEYAAMLAFHTEPSVILDAFKVYSPPLIKWQSSTNEPATQSTLIPIVAAVVQDDAGRVLLVRKKGTRAFMPPGGKLHDLESHLGALDREVTEELKCSIVPDSAKFIGTFTAPAANENGCTVKASLYLVRLQGTANASAEIEEIIWLDPVETTGIELAPLTRDFVLPLVRNHNSEIALNAPGLTFRERQS